MKFRVTMKTPDALKSAITEALVTEPYSDDDLAQTAGIFKVCRKWFEFDEIITVEIDTDGQTCVVVPVK